MAKIFAKNQKYIFLGEDDCFIIYNISSLNLHYQAPTDSIVTSMCCNDTAVYLGLKSGELCKFTIGDSNMRRIRKYKSTITAMSLNELILSVGTESGSFNVMANEVDIEDGLHLAPIRMITSDGGLTYILDQRGRIIEYPSKIIYDNFSPFFTYKNYLFAIDDNLLFCKTNQSFSCAFENDYKIRQFEFSDKGGILLVRDDLGIKVVDFNRKKVLNEIKNTNNFIFDEERGRLIYLNDFSSEGIAVEAFLFDEKMENISFEEQKIEKRVVFMEDDLEEQIVIPKRERKNKKIKKVEFVNNGEKTESTKYNFSSSTTQVEDNNLERLFVDETADEYIKVTEPLIDTYDNKIIDVQQSIITKLGTLLCYNSQGYLLSTESEFYNIVDLKFHDLTVRPIQIKDKRRCLLGSFYGENVVLTDGKTLFFYAPDIEWEMSIEDVSVVNLTENYINIVASGTLRIFRFSSLEIFNCSFNSIRSISSYGDKILVLTSKIVLIDVVNLSRIEYEIMEDISWIYLYEDAYYKSKSRLYKIFNGFSIDVGCVEKIPLCVSSGYLITLVSEDSLIPEPLVEYHKLGMTTISKDTNILNDLVLDRDDDELEKQATKLFKEGKKTLAEEIMKIIGREFSLKDEAAKSVRTKRFKPF